MSTTDGRQDRPGRLGQQTGCSSGAGSPAARCWLGRWPWSRSGGVRLPAGPGRYLRHIPRVPWPAASERRSAGCPVPACPAEAGGLHRWLDLSGLAGNLEHAVAVAVEHDGPTPASDQSPHQGEVAVGVLLRTEHRVDHGAGGGVQGQEQGELGPSSTSHRWKLPSICTSIPAWGIRCLRPGVWVAADGAGWR